MCARVATSHGIESVGPWTNISSIGVKGFNFEILFPDIRCCCYRLSFDSVASFVVSQYVRSTNRFSQDHVSISNILFLFNRVFIVFISCCSRPYCLSRI